MAYPLYPYLKSARKRLTTHPVYHLFDLSVINNLADVWEKCRKGARLFTDGCSSSSSSW